MGKFVLQKTVEILTVPFNKKTGSGGARMYDPTQLPPHPPQQNFYQQERGFFSPSTVNRAIQEAINRHPQPIPRKRVPAVPPPWQRLPVPFQSPSGRKPGSPTIP